MTDMENRPHISEGTTGGDKLAPRRKLSRDAVVASICADKVGSPAQPTFGYRPAVDVLLRSIRRRLASPDG